MAQPSRTDDSSSQTRAATFDAEFVCIGDLRLEYEWLNAGAAGRPLVLLHEGLGSRAMWRDFPRALAEASKRPALVYSRAGYGSSSPAELPRSSDYMHVEALETLPAVLTALGVERPTLVGHSDGASIALIHGGAYPASVEAIVAIAPHVFVEAVTIASIEAAREAYARTDLRTKLARYHADADAAFRGWNDAWLSPAFREWSIVEHLAAITCPLLLLQGSADEYGSEAQLDAIAEGVAGTVERVLVTDARHSPFRDAPQETLDCITGFLARLS